MRPARILLLVRLFEALPGLFRHALGAV